MNFIENESPEKLRGGFYTAPDIARFLTNWALAGQAESVLEPSCGDGAFLDAVQAVGSPRLHRVVAWELDPAEAAKASRRFTNGCGASIAAEVHPGDFLRWYVDQGSQSPRFGAVLGNPPFIRYQYLSDEQMDLAEQIFARFGLGFTKHTNAWVPFVIAALDLLRPGGRLAMVIPSEIFHIRHAQSLRAFLTAHCARIVLLDPEELWFEDTLQGIVLLLAEKKGERADHGQGVAVLRLPDRRALHGPTIAWLDRAEFSHPASSEFKWMSLLLTSRDRALLDTLRDHPCFTVFSRRAEVDVGIVTGANKFFLVPDSVVEAFQLQPWAHPMFGRSAHVSGLVFSAQDHAMNRQAGLPANFLWFDSTDASSYPPQVQAYLQTGVEQGLPSRFKCRVRQPWFRVPSVYATPVAMLKRAHYFPRLILNSAAAFTTDTAYRIQITTGAPASLVYSFVNSLTSLSAELEGRHYGGGVLELVPSEIERLLLPNYTATAGQLQELDEQFRSAPEPEALLQQQDGVVLRACGLNSTDLARIHEAWLKLRARRHRTTATEPAAGEQTRP